MIDKKQSPGGAKKTPSPLQGGRDPEDTSIGTLGGVKRYIFADFGTNSVAVYYVQKIALWLSHAVLKDQWDKATPRPVVGAVLTTSGSESRGSTKVVITFTRSDKFRTDRTDPTGTEKILNSSMRILCPLKNQSPTPSPSVFDEKSIFDEQ